MKGLKIIPIFTVLLTCTYLGTVFVERNHEPVSVVFGASFKTAPAALGLVVLTSVLIGMIVAGALCSVELMVLSMENRRLKRGGQPHPRPDTGATKLPVEKRKEERPASEDDSEPTREYSEPQKGGGSGGGSAAPNRFNPL
jgi:uncharacterized integral membrane protein